MKYVKEGIKVVGCVYYYLLMTHEGQEYLLAAVSLLNSPYGGPPTSHPAYGVSRLCVWPPHATPSAFIPANNIVNKCLMVVLKGEIVAKHNVAHVTTYIHKSSPDPMVEQGSSV